MRRACTAAAGVLALLILATAVPNGAAGPQGGIEVSDAVLDGASAGRTVTVGLPAGAQPATPLVLPLERYVARVIAGEAEPDAPDAARQALAIAVRTFAVVNAGRHARDGYDVCDTTHCQVMRAATAATRTATLATAGRVLLFDERPAEVFYSASCGGRSEDAANVWPSWRFPYLSSVRDDVHGEDEPWTRELALVDVQAALARAGYNGAHLTDVRVVDRTTSGRVAYLRLRGLEPDLVTGVAFRAVLGAAVVRSTAFTVAREGTIVRLTGRGYGHGVGMCVVGAGRLARRGASVERILATYFPGLEIGPAAGGAPVVHAAR